MNPDLEYVSTDDLLDEIKSRFDSCVFAGAKEVDDTNRLTERLYHGDLHICLGLNLQIQGEMLNKMREAYEDAPEDLD